MIGKLQLNSIQNPKNPHFNRLQKQAIEMGINLERLPSHTCIIMDGNGRWAKKRGLNRLIGHREGYRALRKVLLGGIDLKLNYLTVYAFSTENWKRPFEETRGLMKLIETALRSELRLMHRHNVCFKLSGRIDEIPNSLMDALQFGIDITKENTGMTFTLAIAYGGRIEIIDAVKQIIHKGFQAKEITEELISQHMYNPEIPDPDLMIRTSGEMRWSNFLTWESVYSEFYVTQKMWPEFDEIGLLEAILEFQKRDRRFGDTESNH